MTGRDLLELAAKAAGYDTSHRVNAQRLLLDLPVISLWTTKGTELSHTAWNPLNDSGDALRLAVKLGICINFMEDHDSVGAEQSRHGVMIVDAMDDFGTRRAIVRAAADIGRAMP